MIIKHRMAAMLEFLCRTGVGGCLLLHGMGALAQEPMKPVPAPVLNESAAMDHEIKLPRFSEETATAGIRSRFEGDDDEYLVGGGVATFDCDGDQLPDVYVAGGANRAKLYRNQSRKGGALSFVEFASGAETESAVGAYPLDIDGDGLIDLIVLRVGEVEVYRGLGGCRFERANDRWNIHTGAMWHTAFSATWERGNRLPTLAFGTYTDLQRKKYPWGSCTPLLMYRPAPEATRYGEPLRLEPGFCALSMLFFDWNRSGQADLRVSNDREYYKNGQEQLWKMTPGETPRPYGPADGFKPLQIWGMGITSGDLEGDGYPDIFLTSMSDNKLQKLDRGSAGGSQMTIRPSYTDVAFARGATAHRPYVGGDVRPSTAWHAQFEDVNQDGRLDIWVVKGNITTMPDFAARDPNNLLLQKADGSFVEVGDKAGINSYLRGRGGMLVDLNGDGLLDMIVVNRLDAVQVWRNTSEGLGHWLQVRLRQEGGNRDAVGAWIEVDLGGRVIRREVTVGGGHASGHLGDLHFGLGTAESVKLRVLWPHGDWGPWLPLSADRAYVIDKSQGALSEPVAIAK
jgi:hypothetical protein